MAGAPPWKVIDEQGAYQASCKDLIAALTLLHAMYPGGKIRWGATTGPAVYRWTHDDPDLHIAALEARECLARYQENQYRMAHRHADRNT